MKASVYLETTIPSYLAARPSRDIVLAGHQELTRQWWDTRSGYELRASSLVVAECSAGDSDAAIERNKALSGIPILEVNALVENLADALISGVPLPPKAAADAFHVALAAVHGVQYLLTWNCTHIANATLRPRIEAICRREGYEPPVICTPEELLGGAVK